MTSTKVAFTHTNNHIDNVNQTNQTNPIKRHLVVSVSVPAKEVQHTVEETGTRQIGNLCCDALGEC